MYIPEILYSYGFGVRPLGYEEFEKACAILKILIFFSDEKTVEDGFTYTRTRNDKKHKIIILKTTLFKFELIDVAWHEFYHAYYDHYGVRCFANGTEDKYEQQCADFSLCCQIPTLWIRTKTREELLEEGFTNNQINRRLHIYERSEESL
jgi:hypothetical protein